MVMIRSAGSTSTESAFSSVVFPVPVPPETAMLRRDRTAQESSWAQRSSQEPISTSSGSV